VAATPAPGPQPGKDLVLTVCRRNLEVSKGSVSDLEPNAWLRERTCFQCLHLMSSQQGAA
jgi:hypothetical protein